MELTTLRRFIARHCVWWCVAGILISTLQPFLFTHFRHDGWEDEPGLRVRNMEVQASFYPDRRDDHPHALETTLYVPAGAHLDAPHALQQGLDLLMNLVGLLVAFTVSLACFAPAVGRLAKARVPFPGGAPPAAPWRSRPPRTAPPSSI